MSVGPQALSCYGACATEANGTPRSCAGGGLCSCLGCQDEPPPSPQSSGRGPQALKWRTKPKAHVMAACPTSGHHSSAPLGFYKQLALGEEGQVGPSYERSLQRHLNSEPPAGTQPAAVIDQNNLECIRYDILFILSQLENRVPASQQNLP